VNPFQRSPARDTPFSPDVPSQAETSAQYFHFDSPSSISYGLAVVYVDQSPKIVERSDAYGFRKAFSTNDKSVRASSRCAPSERRSLMRKILALCVVVMAGFVVPAEEAPPPGFEQWTASSLKPELMKLAEEAPADPHHFAVRQLADYPNDSFLLVHRAAGRVARNADRCFFVLSGSATLVVDGQLVNGETVGPHEKRNRSIIGGARRKLSAGDIIRIPPRVPHQVLLEGTPEFNYFVIKAKSY
jgi:mannose-6-phosphate isomerase-like protein (cupin superfamily)